MRKQILVTCGAAFVGSHPGTSSTSTDVASRSKGRLALDRVAEARAELASRG